VDGVCQFLKKFFAKSRGQQGLSSYLPFLFESKYIRIKGILKYNRKFLEGISSDQKGGVGTSLVRVAIGNVVPKNVAEMTCAKGLRELLERAHSVLNGIALLSIPFTAVIIDKVVDVEIMETSRKSDARNILCNFRRSVTSYHSSILGHEHKALAHIMISCAGKGLAFGRHSMSMQHLPISLWSALPLGTLNVRTVANQIRNSVSFSAWRRGH
jgi:hypothetical protein